LDYKPIRTYLFFQRVHWKCIVHSEFFGGGGGAYF
jgi:hypothetical protein